jgi:hypothetical protein
MAERTHPELATLLSELSDEEKVKAAQDVAAMIGTPGWALVTGLLERRRGRLVDELVHHGQVRSQAEYAAAVAEVRGFLVVLDVVRTVLRVAEAAAKRLSEREGAS